MRLSLDTNILAFYLYEPDELSPYAKGELFDYSNVLFTSSVCAQELIHLCLIGKIRRDASRVLSDIDEAGIAIVPVTRHHLEKFAALPLYDDHRDPNDRLIIAQAITDRVALISSDHKFSRYRKDGLDFIFNER